MAITVKFNAYRLPLRGVLLPVAAMLVGLPLLGGCGGVQQAASAVAPARAAALPAQLQANVDPGVKVYE